jgi:hypothetical protein
MHSSTDANRNPGRTLGTGSRRVKLNSFEVVFSEGALRAGLATRDSASGEASIQTFSWSAVFGDQACMLRAEIHRRSLPSKTSPHMLTCFVPRRRAVDQRSGSISRRVVASRGTQMPSLSLLCKPNSFKWSNQSSLACTIGR